MAFVSVGAIVASGLFASWRQVRSRRAATETTYGQLLLLKVALVAVLVLLGWSARRTLQARKTLTKSDRPGLLRGMRLEVVFGIGVLVLTSLLVNLAPARESVSKPVGVRMKAGVLNVDLTVDPARKGRNSLHLYALTKSGLQQRIDHAQIFASQPGSGVEPIELKVLRVGPNHFQAINADLPLAGTWTIEVVIGTDQFTEERATTQIRFK